MRAKENRKNSTKAEKKMWNEILRNKLTGYKFVRQKPINNFILDFYSSEILFAIEIDGDSHYENRKYDEKRTVILNKLGIKVIRYTNIEIINSIDGVYLDLLKKIKIRERELNKPPKSPLSGGLELK